MDMEHEVWKIAPGMLGDYEVSNYGNMRRATPGKGTWPGKPIKASVHGNYGHLFVDRKGESGKKEKFYVHRLVLLAFVGPPPEGMNSSRHLDGNGSNNILSNLEWSTPGENTRDVSRMGRNNNANKTHCPKGHPYEGENLRIGARSNRVSRERICRQCLWDQRHTGLEDGDPRHGRITGYHRGCRCEECRQAKRDQRKRLGH